LDAGLRFAEAAVDVACVERHDFCEVAPFWHVALLIKARELEAAWRALKALESGRGRSTSPRMTATMKEREEDKEERIVRERIMA